MIKTAGVGRGIDLVEAESEAWRRHHRLATLGLFDPNVLPYTVRRNPLLPEPFRRCHLRAFFFLGGGTVTEISASVQAFDICLVFLAVSRFIAAIACARAEPATLLAPLRNKLIKGFFMETPFKVSESML